MFVVSVVIAVAAALAVLGIEFRALYMLGKYSTTEIHPQPSLLVF